jgi:hypothetical protein
LLFKAFFALSMYWLIRVLALLSCKCWVLIVFGQVGGGRVRREETKEKSKKFLFSCCTSRGRRRRVPLKTTLFCVLFLCGDPKIGNNIQDDKRFLYEHPCTIYDWKLSFYFTWQFLSIRYHIWFSHL